MDNKMRTLLILMLAAMTLPVVAQTDTAEHRPVVSDKIFTVVEQMPSYPGGEKAMMRFIAEHVQYPAYERKHNIEGRVVVGFQINEDGTVSDIAVKMGVSKGIDAEAVRVIKLLPPFQPGRQKGKPVKVSFILPIMFKLAG